MREQPNPGDFKIVRNGVVGWVNLWEISTAEVAAAEGVDIETATDRLAKAKLSYAKFGAQAPFRLKIRQRMEF